MLAGLQVGESSEAGEVVGLALTDGGLDVVAGQGLEAAQLLAPPQDAGPGDLAVALDRPGALAAQGVGTLVTTDRKSVV